MFPHRTASATKLRPQTGQKNRSGKRPALLLRTLLNIATPLYLEFSQTNQENDTNR